MALDITVYPHLSPRIVVIEEPQTEATVQNIVDTIRGWEDSEEGHTFPYIIDAAGKEDLGGGVLVGITATLNNAQIRFAARPTPITTGLVTTANSDGKFLIDSSADFIAESIPVGATAFNSTTAAMETIVGVDSTSLISFPLQAGTRQDWQVGDSYVIYPNDQCNITGGNLVAVDLNKNSISSVLQSPNTQVVKSSSSSATLTELEAIQYASYGGRVNLDITSSNSGITYPIGNTEFPVNNLVDAIAIAILKGFKTIFIKESMTLSGGNDLSDFTIEGNSHISTLITITTDIICNDLTILNCNVNGVLDGGTYISGCYVGNIIYVNGHINNSGLYGTMISDGNEKAIISDCYMIEQDNPFIIDMGTTGQDLTMTNYSGFASIRNFDSTSNEITIGLDSGQITLENTVVFGSITIGGNGTLVDQTPSSIEVNSNGLLNNTSIANAVVATDEIQSIDKKTKLIPGLF